MCNIFVPVSAAYCVKLMFISSSEDSRFVLVPYWISLVLHMCWRLGLHQFPHSSCAWIIHASEQYRTRITNPCHLLWMHFNTSVFSHPSALTVLFLKCVNPFVKHSENCRICICVRGSYVNNIWDLTPCSLLKVNRRLKETVALNLVWSLFSF
jgi:hypothetical protein